LLKPYSDRIQRRQKLLSGGELRPVEKFQASESTGMFEFGFDFAEASSDEKEVFSDLRDVTNGQGGEDTPSFVVPINPIEMEKIPSYQIEIGQMNVNIVASSEQDLGETYGRADVISGVVEGRGIDGSVAF